MQEEIQLKVSLDATRLNKQLQKIKGNFNNFQGSLNKGINKQFNKRLDYGMTNNASYFGLSSLLVYGTSRVIQGVAKNYGDFQKNIIRNLGITGKQLTQANYELEKTNILKESYNSILGINKYLESNKFFLKKGFSERYTKTLISIMENIERYFDVPIQVGLQTVSDIAKQFNFSREQITPNVNRLARASDITSIDFEKFSKGLTATRVAPARIGEDFSTFVTLYSILKDKGYTDALAGGFYREYYGGSIMGIRRTAYNAILQSIGKSNQARLQNLFPKFTDQKALLPFLAKDDGSGNIISPLQLLNLFEKNDEKIKSYFRNMFIQGQFGYNNKELERAVANTTRAFKAGFTGRQNVSDALNVIKQFSKEEFKAREDIYRDGKRIYRKGFTYNKRDNKGKIIESTRRNRTEYRELLIKQSGDYLTRVGEFTEKKFRETILQTANTLKRGGLLLSEGLTGFVSLISKPIKSAIDFFDVFRQDFPRVFSFLSGAGGFALGSALIPLVGLGAIGASRAYGRFALNEAMNITGGLSQAVSGFSFKNKNRRWFESLNGTVNGVRDGKYKIYDEKRFQNLYKKNKQDRKKVRAYFDQFPYLRKKYEPIEYSLAEKRNMREYFNKSPEQYEKYRDKVSFKDFSKYKKNQRLYNDPTLRYALSSELSGGFISVMKQFYSRGGIFGALSNRYGSNLLANQTISLKQFKQVVSENKKGFLGFKGISELMSLFLFSKGIDGFKGIFKQGGKITLFSNLFRVLKGGAKIFGTLFKTAFKFTKILSLPLLAITGIVSAFKIYGARRSYNAQQKERRKALHDEIYGQYGNNPYELERNFQNFRFSDKERVEFGSLETVRQKAEKNTSLFTAFLDGMSNIYHGVIGWTRAMTAILFNNGVIENFNELPNKQKEYLMNFRNSGRYLEYAKLFNNVFGLGIVDIVPVPTEITELNNLKNRIEEQKKIHGSGFSTGSVLGEFFKQNPELSKKVFESNSPRVIALYNKALKTVTDNIKKEVKSNATDEFNADNQEVTYSLNLSKSQSVKFIQLLSEINEKLDIDIENSKKLTDLILESSE